DLHLRIGSQLHGVEDGGRSGHTAGHGRIHGRQCATCRSLTAYSMPPDAPAAGPLPPIPAASLYSLRRPRAVPALRSRSVVPAGRIGAHQGEGAAPTGSPDPRSTAEPQTGFTN